MTPIIRAPAIISMVQTVSVQQHCYQDVRPITKTKSVKLGSKLLDTKEGTNTRRRRPTQRAGIVNTFRRRDSLRRRENLATSALISCLPSGLHGTSTIGEEHKSVKVGSARPKSFISNDPPI